MKLKKLRKQIIDENAAIKGDIEALCNKWGCTSMWQLEEHLKENDKRLIKVERLIDDTEDLLNPAKSNEDNQTQV